MDELVNPLAIGLGLATFIAGIWQFYRASKRSAMAPFLEKRLELYEAATRVAGCLVALERGDQFDKKRDEFWALYYGPMALVEDVAVEKAMVRFGHRLKEVDSKSESADESLFLVSLELADACRSSISESWDLNLTPLANRIVNE